MDIVRGRTARWVGGAIAICLVLVAVNWFGLMAPRRSEVADLQDRTTSVAGANSSLRTRIEQLRAEYADLPRTRQRLAEIRRQMPAGTDMSALVRAVDSLATRAGVELVSFTPSVAKPLASQGAAGASGKASVAAGLISVPVSVVVAGDYFQAVAFLRDLQTGLPRAFLVSGLQIDKAAVAGEEGEKVQVSISGQVYCLVDPATVATGSPGSAVSPGSSTGPSTGSSAGSTESVPVPAGSSTAPAAGTTPKAGTSQPAPAAARVTGPAAVPGGAPW